MCSGVVTQIHATIVYVEATIVLPFGMVLFSDLAFGPFETMDEAKRWTNEIEEIHARKNSAEEVLRKPFFADGDEPTRPYIEFHMVIHDIVQSPEARKFRDNLFPPEAPEIAEGKVPEYVFRLVQERTSDGCDYFDKEH